MKREKTKELLGRDDFGTTVERVNARFEIVLDDLLSVGEHNVQSERLRYCNARVYYIGHYIVLKSYNTYVAIFSTLSHRLFINGWYSATTQQQISKFIKDYCDGISKRLQNYTNSRGIYYYNYTCASYRKHLKTGDYEYQL